MTVMLSTEYVQNIPWRENPLFAFPDDSAVYTKAFESVIDFIPVNGGLVDFNNDAWDFNPYFDGINDDGLKIIFSGLEQPVLDYCKFFVLHKIMGAKKISAANLRIAAFKSVYIHIRNSSETKSIFTISTEDIIAEIRKRNTQPSTEHNLYESVYEVYEFIINNYHADLPVDIEVLKQYGIKSKRISKIIESEKKLPDIPKELYDAILGKAVEIMRNERANYSDRSFACALVMLTQLGMRLGDLLAIRTDQMKTVKLKKTGKTARYIHYKARKPSKPHDKMLEFDIFCNDLCSEAFNTLLEIRAKSPLSFGNDYLYVPWYTKKEENILPAPNYRFNSLYKKFLYEYLPEYSRMQWEGIRQSLYYFTGNDAIRISVPDTRQYRVHICTALYEHGVHLTYIQKYMGHLSEYMLGYYARPKNQFQENIEYSEKIIREIAGEDLTPVHGSFGKEIKEYIKTKIEESGLNVYTDISEIIRNFGDRLIIRAKTGGFCIKTSILPCSRDVRTNAVLCAYGSCPNLYSFYYMCDASYADFKTIQNTYESNKNQGLMRAAEYELVKIKTLCRNRLLPELNQLDEEIQAKGVKAIIEKYPDLSEIISRRDEIREEIRLWTQK